MPREGLEPSRPEGPGILSPVRLPFRHPGTSFDYTTGRGRHTEGEPPRQYSLPIPPPRVPNPQLQKPMRGAG